jgi:hypothetical protein
VTFSAAEKTIGDEKISLKVSSRGREEVNNLKLNNLVDAVRLFIESPRPESVLYFGR